MRKQMRWVALVLAGVLTAACGTTRPGPATRPAMVINNAPRPKLDVPYARVTPRMDAQGGDSAWAAAAVIPSLSLSLGPSSDGRTAFPTEARLLWDEKYLYIRFTCQGGDLYSPFEGRDEPHCKGDVVEVFLDPKGDSRQWVELQLSPNNQVLDALDLVTTEPRSGEDLRLIPQIFARDVWGNKFWNLDNLRTATSRLRQGSKEVGWIAELALPADGVLKRLGRRNYQPMTMRINIIRYEWVKTDDGSRRLTAMNWAPVLCGCPHMSPQAMGFITLLPKAAETAGK